MAWELVFGSNSGTQAEMREIGNLIVAIHLPSHRTIWMQRYREIYGYIYMNGRLTDWWLQSVGAQGLTSWFAADDRRVRPLLANWPTDARPCSLTCQVGGEENKHPLCCCKYISVNKEMVKTGAVSGCLMVLHQSFWKLIQKFQIQIKNWPIGIHFYIIRQ
jgi:hypothetical protein